MGKIIGIGGIYINSSEKEMLNTWYKDILEIPMEIWGCTIKKTERLPCQVFSIMNPTSKYIPENKQFMINFAVDDLNDFCEKLKSKGIEILQLQENDFGKFAWILDPLGQKIELWQPPLNENK
jgi:predicted enzyme related to lactoylglutathione lyase